MRQVVLVAILGVLAGCLEEGSGGQSSKDDDQAAFEESSDPAPGPTSDKRPNAPSLALPDRIGFSECRGGRTIYDAPAAAFPGQRPPGWSESSLYMTSIDLELFSCNRISVGPFERGPIAMAIEHHSNHHTPDSCADEDAYTYSQVISFVALNDSAIAEYLAIQFAMPTFYTDIKISEQVFPHGRTETWTIGNSSDSIEVNLVNHGQGGATGVLVERLFWFNDTHLGFTDLELSYETDAGGLTWGSMQAPSIISETKPTPPYVGVGGTIDELVIEAPITLYEGFDCKKQVV